MAQDIVYASLEDSGDSTTREIKIFTLEDPVIYSWEIIQQKNKALSMMLLCDGQHYLKSVNI